VDQIYNIVHLRSRSLYSRPSVCRL